MKQRFYCIARLLLLAALLPLVGCAGDGRFALFSAPTPLPTATPVPTPTPAPTPTPVIALYGAQDAPAFVREVERATLYAGYGFAALPDEAALTAFDPAGNASVIICSEDGVKIGADLKNAYYCMLDGGAIPAGFHGARYDGTSTAETALDELLTYPPHCAPVRVLGLFSSEESAARAAYDAYCDAGKLFSRGAFVQSEKNNAADWLNDKLDDIYPGMLDAIFAETGVLAVTAAGALITLGRDDAEIFSASTGGEALLSIMTAPHIACAVGYDPKRAAEACVNNAILLIIGENAVDNTLKTTTFMNSPETE